MKNLAGKKFALIGINSDPDPADPQRLVKDNVVTWRSFWNGDKGPRGPISTSYGVRSWPTIYLLDAKGVVRHKNLRGEALNKAIAELMEENGEEFPAEQVDKDTVAEEARGAKGGDGANVATGNMSTDQMRKEAMRRAKERKPVPEGENRYGDDDG